jgi:hypothetical protein
MMWKIAFERRDGGKLENCDIIVQGIWLTTKSFTKKLEQKYHLQLMAL